MQAVRITMEEVEDSSFRTPNLARLPNETRIDLLCRMHDDCTTGVLAWHSQNMPSP